MLNVTNNASIFATPSPTLSSINTAIANLETAETLANTRVTGSASARDLKYDILLKAIHGLLNYVQTLADNAVDEPTAISIINASGFDLKSIGTRTKAPLAVNNGDVSGSVDLIAKSAGFRSAYNWRKSVDGVIWSDLSPTIQAKTIVTGLTPATTQHFQYRAITKEGAGSWSQPVSIVVQ